MGLYLHMSRDILDVTRHYDYMMGGGVMQNMTVYDGGRGVQKHPKIYIKMIYEHSQFS